MHNRQLINILKQLSDYYRDSETKNGFSAYDNELKIGLLLVPVEDKEMLDKFVQAGKQAIDDTIIES